MMKKAWYKYLIIGSVVFLAIVAIIFVIDKKNKTRITNSDKNLQVSGDNIQKADSKAPVITLIGSPEITIEAGTDYEDSGCMAVDEADGDISEKVTKDKLVDSDVTGDVKIIYSVKNSAGIEVHTERIVHVVDTTAPDINLIDGTTYYIKNGTQYCEPGYEAEDSCDGNLTSKVKVSGNVDTQTDGKYTLTYEVEDAAGNKTSVERCVRVYSPMPDNTVNPGNKVVYLTFDDGPGKYTQRLLDVLDKYNVNATFFVTNGKPAYQNLVGADKKQIMILFLLDYIGIMIISAILGIVLSFLFCLLPLSYSEGIWNVHKGTLGISVLSCLIPMLMGSVIVWRQQSVRNFE